MPFRIQASTLQLCSQLPQLKKRDADLKQEVNALMKELQHVRDKERKLIDEVDRIFFWKTAK
jgi:formiminotetrahydrofolate cyclodeaminase